jgi:hypothetical protein
MLFPARNDKRNFIVGDDNVIPIPAAGLQAVHGPAGST